jgi:hypothetical protein
MVKRCKFADYIERRIRIRQSSGISSNEFGSGQSKRVTDFPQFPDWFNANHRNS